MNKRNKSINLETNNTESGLNLDNNELLSTEDFLRYANKKNKAKNKISKNNNNISIGISSIKNNDTKLAAAQSIYHLNRSQTKDKKNKVIDPKHSRSINRSREKKKKKDYYSIPNENENDNSNSLSQNNIKKYENTCDNMLDDNLNNSIGHNRININKDNLFGISLKYGETNNIINYKKDDEENISSFMKFNCQKRLTSIINNSPFIDSNIFLNFSKNNKNIFVPISPILISEENLKNFNAFYDNNFAISKKHKMLLDTNYKTISSSNKYKEIINGVNENIDKIDPLKTNISQLHKYNINNGNKLLKDRYIRDISNLDGNAFIRAFIYEYFEKSITLKKIDNFYFVMYKFNEISKKQKILKSNITEIFSLFKIIIDFVENDNLKDAYKFLLILFSDYYLFDQLILVFIRFYIKDFIDNYNKYFSIDYLKEVVQNNFINDNLFKNDLYTKEVITLENNELQYEILIYYLIPILFNIDLVIYTNNNSKSNKLIFNSIKNNENEKIELNNKFGNISIIYPENFDIENNLIPFKSINIMDPVDKCKIIKNEEDKIICYQCEKKQNELVFLNKNFELICKECLVNIINKIIDKKYLLFTDTDNNFFHEEYYCNKIKINALNNLNNANNSLNNTLNINNIQNETNTALYISINDIKNILPSKKTISDEIYSRIINIYKCIKCKQNFNNNNAYCLNYCGHLICENCLKEYILGITKDRVILNYFEILSEKIKYECPSCNKEIFISKNLINNLFDDETYITKAENRIVENSKKKCCICLNDKVKYKFVISDPISDDFKLLHGLCVDCDKKLKEEFDKNNKNKKLTELKCVFCEKNHLYNTLKFDVKRKKSCCAVM